MRKSDDCSLTAEQRARVRLEAERALNRANAVGRFPTAVADIMSAAKIQEVAEDILSASFLANLRKKASGALKRALGKILGVFDAAARIVFIDRTLVLVKQTFVRLHETAHAVLPWQSALYAVVEEDQLTIAPDTAELFDREANAFASEVLFQLDGFCQEAEQEAFGILVPVHLCKKYGASIYSAVRRYVSGNHRACAVLVLDPPVICAGDGFTCNLRRVIVSDRYSQLIGKVDWPEYFTPADSIGAMVPIGKRRMSGKRSIGVKDKNGDRRECIAEAFTQGHQAFILLHVAETLRPRIVHIVRSIA